jgi:hypothetical protein
MGLPILVNTPVVPEGKAPTNPLMSKDMSTKQLMSLLFSLSELFDPSLPRRHSLLARVDSRGTFLSTLEGSN